MLLPLIPAMVLFISLAKKSKSKNEPLIVTNSHKKTIGVITQSNLLKAVVEGSDGE